MSYYDVLKNNSLTQSAIVNNNPTKKEIKKKAKNNIEKTPSYAQTWKKDDSCKKTETIETIEPTNTKRSNNYPMQKPLPMPKILNRHKPKTQLMNNYEYNIMLSDDSLDDFSDGNNYDQYNDLNYDNQNYSSDSSSDEW